VKKAAHPAVKHAPPKRAAVKHAAPKKAHNIKKAAPKKVQPALRLKMKPRNRAENDKKCQDKAENCFDFIGWCKETAYMSILKRFCDKSCGSVLVQFESLF
jgi:hypothetical protein